MENKKIYRIALQLFCGYDIEATSEDEALEKAYDYFAECTPEVVDCFCLNDDDNDIE